MRPSRTAKPSRAEVGNLVYAVSPVTLSQQEIDKLAKRDRGIRFEGTFAVLLTRDVGNLGPSWGYFIIAGGAALVIAALIAWQMSRRMARPLVEATQATGRIASGDLESRVPIHKHDYPEFASLAGSINDMAQSLEDSRARERHLLLAVSHDLRTPLTSIRGFAEAIKDGAIDDSGRAADVIIAESRRLERLVGDLLDLTKLEAHQMSIAMRADRCGRGGHDDGRGLPARRGEERHRHRAARGRIWLDAETDADRRGPGAVPSRPTPSPPRAVPAAGGGRSRPARPDGGQPDRERVHLRPQPGHRRPDGRRARRRLRHHRRRQRPGHRAERPRARLRALLPSRPGPEPADGLGPRARHRGGARLGHGRGGPRRLAARARRGLALRGLAGPLAGARHRPAPTPVPAAPRV